MGRIKIVMLENFRDNSRICPPVETYWLTDRSCDNLSGLSCRSGWAPFGNGGNLSQKCLLLLINYRRCLWVVTGILEIVQRSPYIHMGKLLFMSSMPTLLQFVVVGLTWVLVVGNVVLILFMDGFTLFSTLCHVIGLWLIWLLNVNWL